MSVIEKTSYSRLAEDQMKSMVHSAVFELEKLHFETKLNIVLNSEDHVQNFEDGTSMRLGDRLRDLEEKLDKLKTEFADLL